MKKIGYTQSSDKDVVLFYKHLENLNKTLNIIRDKDPDKAKDLEHELYGKEDENPKVPTETIIPMDSIQVAGILYYLKRLLKGKEEFVYINDYKLVNIDYTEIPNTESVVNQIVPDNKIILDNEEE